MLELIYPVVANVFLRRLMPSEQIFRFLLRSTLFILPVVQIEQFRKLICAEKLKSCLEDDRPHL